MCHESLVKKKGRYCLTSFFETHLILQEDLLVLLLDLIRSTLFNYERRLIMVAGGSSIAKREADSLSSFTVNFW